MSLYAESVGDEITEMMMLDGYDGSKKEKIISLAKQVLTTKTYIDTIQKDLDKIFEDKKVTADDVSRMMMISLKLNNLLSQSMRLKKKIELSQMKYILYSVLYCYILNKQPDFFNELSVVEFRLLFNSLWVLLEIDPNQIKVAAKKCTAWCCGKSDVKETSHEPVSE